MTAHGGDARRNPDVTARVMQRLGYVQADERRARAIRRRTYAVRVLQGTIILSAVALGTVWWFGGAEPAHRTPEVVGTLRGSVTRGAGSLDGFLAGLPRMPQTSVMPVDTQGEQPAPAPSLENAPQLRSY